MTRTKLAALLNEKLATAWEGFTKGDWQNEVNVRDFIQKNMRASLAQEALAHAEGAYLLEERPRERIFLCPPAPDGLSGEESEIFAYEYAAGKGVHLGHPAGVLITPDSTAQPASRRYPVGRRF